MIRRVLRIIKKNQIIFFRSGVKLGKNVVLDWNVNIYNNKNKVIIGNNVFLRGNPKGYHAGLAFPTTILLDAINSSVRIGNNCRINGAYIHSKKKILIGENCVIASGVNIIDSNGHILLSTDRTKGRDNAEEIIIGNNVWIGLNATILKGAIIGENSVIAAGSVVKGIFPPNSLIVGNPAVLVKELKINLK